MKFAGLAAAAAILLTPVPAQACLASSFHLALIHSALPTPLPEGTIIAEVELEAADWNTLHSSGLRARIRRMIQGDYRGDTLILRPAHQTSCDNPFDNGLTGYVVGVARGSEDGALVIDPIAVARNAGFRLPDGFQLARPRP